MRRAPAARLAAAALASVVLAAGGARAQPLYVIDQLVVNLNSSADSSGERVASIRSGERVELIERSGDAVHVRLANGRDGWLRASYLSADEPLTVRLAQREEQLTQAQNELAQARAQLSATSAASGAAPARASTGAAAEEPARAPAPLFSPRQEPAHALWPWVAAGTLVGAMCGFMLGVLLLDRYIRRKFGGLRIY